MGNRDINLLTERTRQKWLSFQDDVSNYTEYEIFLTDWFRTAAEQNALYQQGRTTPWPIVTYVDWYKYISNHQLGLAVDIAFQWEELYPNNPKIRREVADIWIAEWFDRWFDIRGFDKPHFQDNWKDIIVREILVQEAINKWYYNWVEWDWVTDRTVLMTMKAIEGEKPKDITLQGVKLSDIVLDYTDIPDWADDDRTYKTIEESMTLQEMKAKFPVCKTNYFRRIQKKPKLQLAQDEFEEKSNRCTLYANLASLTHWGIDANPTQRERLYNRYQENWFYKDWKWASTIAISKLRGKALKETWVYTWKVQTYVFKTWSFELNWLMIYHNYFAVTATVLSNHFARDRNNDGYINWDIHGWKVYWWHAHWWCAINPNLFLRTNSYADRSNNHSFMSKKQLLQYNSEMRAKTKKYVRDYSAIHIYW